MPWDNSPAARARSNRVYGSAWRRARAQQLARNPNCQLAYDGCTVKATQVDHIHGADADPHHQHLRSVCAHCHALRTAREQGGGYRQRTPPHDPQPRPATMW